MRRQPLGVGQAQYSRPKPHYILRDYLIYKMKANSSNPRKQAKADDRFNEVYSDPRFMTVPKKLKKVEIDDRFKKALTSKEFNLVQKVDKYGHTVNKQDNTMK